MFGAILVMTLSISAIIRYPETIKLPVKIQTTNNPADAFALAEITQDNFTKVKIGQQVLIHLKVYSSDAYEPVKGMVSNIADSPNGQGLFTIKVKLNVPGAKSPVKLKSWMTGSAEIITQDITVLQRVTKSLIRNIN
jgi:HlyD family secretion protein